MVGRGKDPSGNLLAPLDKGQFDGGVYYPMYYRINDAILDQDSGAINTLYSLYEAERTTFFDLNDPGYVFLHFYDRCVWQAGLLAGWLCWFSWFLSLCRSRLFCLVLV